MFDSFNHFLARMEWTDVLMPNRYTACLLFVSISCQISLTLTGWVKFPIADGTYLSDIMCWIDEVEEYCQLLAQKSRTRYA